MAVKWRGQLGWLQVWELEPPENLLGASMPLQLHVLGAVVAEVTAHPSREVGVGLGAGDAAMGGTLGMAVFGGTSGEDEDEGGGEWLYGLKDPPPCWVLPSCANLPSERWGW